LKVPFNDLKNHHAPLRERFLAEFVSVLDSSEFILGSRVEKFERNFARYCGAKHCVALNSGTDAIRVGLLANGVGPKDEVITAANSFIASVEPIVECGATPVLVDVDKSTYNMDCEELEKKITPKTKAILPVHLYGQPADMKRISEIAKKYGLVVLEDACQAHGAELEGKRMPFFGDGAYSFFPGKNLGALGDAGAFLTSDANRAEIARQLRDHGRVAKYEFARFGYNSRMDGLQGAFLDAKLPFLDDWVRERNRVARVYFDLLGSFEKIQLPTIAKGVLHAFHLFVMQVQNRDEVLERLKKQGILAGVHYPIPLYRQAPVEKYCKNRSFPITEKSSQHILSLPIFPEMTDEQAGFVANTLKKVVK
jgi:dTDP-4-amino-4,6-dideoxygalactose transaminase